MVPVIALRVRKRTQNFLLCFYSQYILTKIELTKFVSLDGEKVERNPGLRALAKLCLNSFWGKFGQRLNLKQSQFYHETEADAFFRVLSDPTKEVQDFHIVANDTIQVEWIYKKDCQPEDNKTNIYLATFTTCWARLKLYSVLEKVNRNVLYYDTDSVIYVSSPGKYDPPFRWSGMPFTNSILGISFLMLS